MNGSGGYLDPRRWRSLAAYLAGIAVETLYTFALVGIGALVTLGLWLSSR
jgi:hypothetical protein